MKTFYALSSVSVGTLLIDNTADGLPIWLWRAFVTVLIGLIIYLYKQTLDSAKLANVVRDTKITDCEEKYTKLLTLCAAHEVMYQVWLEEVTSGNDPHPLDGKRKTDMLHRIITQIAETNR